MMKRIFFISLVLIYTGCVGTKPTFNKLREDKQSFCEKKFEAKSLEFLEQQYKCTNN